MKKLIKIELYRSFHSRTFGFAIAIGTILSILQLVMGVIPTSIHLEEYLAFNMPMKYPGFLYVAWIGGDLNSFFSYLYFLILPIISALPFADSFFMDAKGGFIQNICIRANKKQYYLSKYIATFLSGGSAVTFPLILNFLISMLLLPSMKPETTAGTGLIGEASTFPQLYYNHPILYVLLFLAIIFIFSGLLADFGLVSSYIAGYRFLVLLAPFILYLFLMAGFNLIGIDSWQPINFLRPSYSQDALIPMILETIILFLITAFGFIYRGGKGDIY